MKYKVNYIINRFEKKYISVFADFEELLKNPIKCEKAECPLINFGKSDVKDLTLRAGYDWKYTTALVLDYDDSITYDAWVSQHQDLLDYEYYAYASAGNTEDKHKFRIIFPLELKINEDELKWFYKNKLKRIFEGNDQCSVQCSRFHNIPCKTSSNVYWYVINKSIKKLNLKEHFKFDESWYRLYKNHLKELNNEFESPIERKEYNNWSVFESQIKSIGMSIKDWCETDWQVGQSNGGKRYAGFVASIFKAKKYQDHISLSAIRDRCYRCGLEKEFQRAISK